MLQRAGLTLQDFDFYEIHEAFAAQVLCTLKAWEDRQILQGAFGPGQTAGLDRPQQAEHQR
jgi:acetyl-CoA C-acetyltransferase